MSRNPRPLSENKLDDEFPPLSSLSKPNSNVQFASSVLQQSGSMNSPLAKSSSAGIYSPKKQKVPISLSTAEQFAVFDIKGPESFLQTEFLPQDFNLALSSSFNYIPDTPYDVNESELYSQSSSNTGNSVNSTTDLQSTDNLQIRYPTCRNMKLLQPEFLRKYDLTTLFYIFFFSPGTPQQYFAGQELKNRDWFYNTKFQTWFHRISEPTEKTSSYEVAKFEYFDHSESWIIRESPSFKFEYDQLCE